MIAAILNSVMIGSFIIATSGLNESDDTELEWSSEVWNFTKITITDADNYRLRAEFDCDYEKSGYLTDISLTIPSSRLPEMPLKGVSVTAVLSHGSSIVAEHSVPENEIRLAYERKLLDEPGQLTIFEHGWLHSPSQQSPVLLSELNKFKESRKFIDGVPLSSFIEKYPELEMALFINDRHYLLGTVDFRKIIENKQKGIVLACRAEERQKKAFSTQG